jgi:NADPH:quinone reductase-like Zn-dependent oxidoreductase
LGADVVIDYKKEDFATILKDYDSVLRSQDPKTLDKSLRILNPSGKVISISGPPDPECGKEIDANWFLKMLMKFLSTGTRKKGARLGVNFSFYGSKRKSVGRNYIPYQCWYHQTCFRHGISFWANQRSNVLC